MNCGTVFAISSALLLILLLSGINNVVAYNVTYVELPANPTDIGFSGIDGTAYAVTPGNESVQVLDGRNDTIIDSMSIASPRHVAFDSEYGNLYVSACEESEGCSIHVMDGRNYTIIDRIPIPSQVGPFVPTFRDITYDTVIQTIPLEGIPEGIAFDFNTNSMLVETPLLYL